MPLTFRLFLGAIISVGVLFVLVPIGMTRTPIVALCARVRFFVGVNPAMFLQFLLVRKPFTANVANTRFLVILRVSRQDVLFQMLDVAINFVAKGARHFLLVKVFEM